MGSSCGLVSNPATGKRQVVFVGGVDYGSVGDASDETEIFDMDTLEWSRGKQFVYNFFLLF